MAYSFLTRATGHAKRIAGFAVDLLGAIRPATRRLHPSRIGLICLIDLVQDLELILPVAQAARANGNFEVLIVATDWLDRVAPWAGPRINDAGFRPIRHTRDAVLCGAAPALEGWEALLTASESTSPSHRFGHTLARRSRGAGLVTFTMQHGLENIGLTYRGDGDYDFASDWIFTWGDPATLPDWVAESVRVRCIGAGRPEASGPASIPKPLPIDPSDQRPIVAVFENLHWQRYDDSYRRRFLSDLAATVRKRENMHFVLRPHPAGLFTAKYPPDLALKNFTVADPRVASWSPIEAKDLIAKAAAAVTTPSTIALDAARQSRTFAVARYDLDLEAYAPAPMLDSAEDWLHFLDGALNRRNDESLIAFRQRHHLEGDASAAILSAIAHRVTRRPAPTPFHVRAAAKLARMARALPLAPLLPPAGAATPSRREYARWIKAYEPDSARLEAMRANAAQASPGPSASIIIDARAAAAAALRHTRQSIERQVAPCSEVIVCGDGEALGGALQTAKGRYAALVKAGDLLAPHALHVLLAALREVPSALLAYSDEDLVDVNGRRSNPHFKPAWSAELFLGQDYACRLALFDADAARAVGGFGEGPADAELYDVILRVAAHAPTRPILHTPSVLYHRAAGQAPADEAMAASVQRRAGDADVMRLEAGLRRVRRPLRSPPPLVSLIVPTRDRLELLRRCVEGLRDKTEYPAIEIVVVDNNSEDPATLVYLEEIKADARVRVIRDEESFNFSRLNNLAASQAQGELLGLINNDIAVIEPNWLDEMVALARQDVGAVGAMLLYPDGRIQHAGCTLGIGGVASHLYNGLPADVPGHGHRLRVVHEVSAVTGACLITPRTAWDEVGGLDETLPVAYNDIDYCLKLKRAGQRILWTPFARLEHHESASRGRDETGVRRTRLEREKARMRARWGAQLQEDQFYSPNLSLAGTEGRLAHPPRAPRP